MLLWAAVGLGAAVPFVLYVRRHLVEVRWAVLRFVLGGVWKSRQQRDLAAESAVMHLIEADVVMRSDYGGVLPLLEAAPSVDTSTFAAADRNSTVNAAEGAVGQYKMIRAAEHLEAMRSAIESRSRADTARACDAIVAAALPHVRVAGREAPLTLDDCAFCALLGGRRTRLMQRAGVLKGLDSPTPRLALLMTGRARLVRSHPSAPVQRAQVRLSEPARCWRAYRQPTHSPATDEPTHSRAAHRWFLWRHPWRVFPALALGHGLDAVPTVRRLPVYPLDLT
jgi:hypothetical protein